MALKRDLDNFHLAWDNLCQEVKKVFQPNMERIVKHKKDKTVTILVLLAIFLVILDTKMMSNYNGTVDLEVVTTFDSLITVFLMMRLTWMFKPDSRL